MPKAMLSNCPRLTGPDGNSEMGKSLGNAIYPGDSRETVEAKVRCAVTDPSRIHKNDIGHPGICVVNKYHQIFNSNEANNISEMCGKGCIGCASCKNRLCEALNEVLDPIRERRAFYENRTELVKELVQDGSRKANIIGDIQTEKVKAAMFLKI